ncbi:MULTISPECIES: hypothetical protein [Pseudomonadales]|uniref:hypothetical protein n=1 Tax=Pseudomonadales TaxID=72274 RepID=UPI001F4714C7|nr:hypothetical protein [Stutzerimonas degradans]MCF6751145.1 hypothetical protein [Stutzerimonas stutzeri]
MVDAAAGTCQAYNADDFEGAAERLLGKRYQILKELEATTTQICSAFSEAFFSGELGENDENQNDISLMLTASTEFFLGAGQQLISDSQPQTMPRPKLELADLLRSDTPPDRADFCVGPPPQR